MKKLEIFLNDAGIEHENNKFGDDYFNDNFSVDAITVKFDYELTDNIKELERKEKLFKDYMKRNKRVVIGYSGKCGVCIPYYHIFNTFDFARLKEHENKKKNAVDAYWNEKHALIMGVIA